MHRQSQKQSDSTAIKESLIAIARLWKIKTIQDKNLSSDKGSRNQEIINGTNRIPVC